MRDRLPWLGVPLALLLLGPALHPGRTAVGADLFTFNLPQLEALGRAYRAGHVPGWSPHLGPGQPFLADPCIAAHYPGHLLAAVLSPAMALAWLLALHVVLTHAGVYRLGRRLGLSPTGAALAGVAFSLGGVAQSHVHGPSLLLATAWMPWAALATVWALEAGAPRRRLLVAAAPFALMYLAGMPETAALSGLFAWAVALHAGVGLRAATLGLLAIAGLSVALAASTLVPFVAVLGDTHRAGGLPYEVAGRWSLHPLELLGLLVPGVFGADGLPSASIGHEGRPWFPSLHLGAVTFAALVLGLAGARADRRARFLLLCALPFLLYALGRFGPLHPLLFEALPPLRSFRYPAKAFVPAALCLCLLAGAGLDRTRACGVRDLRVALPGAGALAGGVALWALSAGLPALAARAGWTALAAAAALAATLAPARLRARAVVGLALLELALVGDARVDVAPVELYTTPPPLAGVVQRLEAAAGAPLRVASLRSAFEARGVDVKGVSSTAMTQRGWREALFPNTGLTLGLRSARGFSSFTPGRVSALHQAALATDEPAARELRALGASLVVLGPDDPLRGEVAPVVSLGPWGLARFPAAGPWAALYARAEVVPDRAAAVARVLDPAFDPRASCVIEEPGAPTAPGRPGRVGHVSLIALEDERVALAVDAPAPCVLVLREGWGTGWRATVGGVEAPLLPADALFRAVRVPAGRHEVVFTYAAPGRTAGALLALLAWLALVAAIVRERRDLQVQLALPNMPKNLPMTEGGAGTTSRGGLFA